MDQLHRNSCPIRTKAYHAYGVDTLHEFVLASAKRNYEYVFISDHSTNAHYAGRLKEQAIKTNGRDR